MIQWLDLKVDYAFKRLFGTEKNKAVTIAFLNDVLERVGGDAIVDVTFENVEIAGETPEAKKSRLDVLAKLPNGKRVNIEIQFNDRYDMVPRTLFYWSRLYTEPMRSGESYNVLRPVITINIVNFTQFPRDVTDDYHTKFTLQESHHKFPLTDLCEIHFLEIPKFMQRWRKQQVNVHAEPLALWLLLLGSVDQHGPDRSILTLLEGLKMSERNLELIFSEWEIMSMDAKSRREYEVRLKELLDEQSVKYDAEMRQKQALEEGLQQGLQQGLRQGIEEGLRQGREQGIQQGIEQGLQEGIERGIEKGIEQGIEKGIEQGIEKGIEQGQQQAKREIAETLLANGMPFTQVAAMLHYSEEELQRLLS